MDSLKIDPELSMTIRINLILLRPVERKQYEKTFLCYILQAGKARMEGHPPMQ